MAFDAFGTIIKIGDSTNGTSTGWPDNNDDSETGASVSDFTTIAEVRDSEGPTFSIGDTEVTYHGATGERKQYIPGLKEGGEVTTPVNLLPMDSSQGSSSGLLSDYKNRTQGRDFVIVFSDTNSSKLWFTGYVKNFAPGHPVEGQLTADITLKVDGEKIILPNETYA